MYTGTVDGKKKYTSITADTKKKAELLAAQYSLQEKMADLPTFGQAAERFFSANSNTLSPNTVRGYRNCHARLSDLDHIRIDRLTNEQIQKTINQMAGKYSYKTIKNTYGFFTAVISMFDPSRVFQVSFPEPAPVEVHVPTTSEVQLMIKTAQGEMKLAIQLAAFGSLRLGEVCALKSDCIFEDHIQIRRNYVMDENKKWLIKESPKTFAGFRDVPLQPDLIEDLRAAVKEDGLVFHRKPNSLSDGFRKHCRKIGLFPYKFHSLRYYFATFCHAQGIPDQYIMKIGGWDDANTMTRIYRHTLPEKMDDVVKAIFDFRNMVMYDTKYDTE